VIFVLLARGGNHVRKSVVHPHQPGPRHMRQYAIEDAAAARILVEASMDKVADAASALRAAPAIGLLYAARSFAKRISLTRCVLTLVF